MEPTDGGDSRKLWLKAELHAHCSLDPADCRICPHSPEDLIERAAALGYRVLAITCHNLDIWTPGLAECARSRGIVLVPGMEVAADDGRHVLAYNFRAAPEELDTLAKIRARSGRDTLVIAPHPFYPGPMSLRERLASNADAFDAVEYSGFRVRGSISTAARPHSPAGRTSRWWGSGTFITSGSSTAPSPGSTPNRRFPPSSRP